MKRRKKKLLVRELTDELLAEAVSAILTYKHLIYMDNYFYG